MDPLLPFPPVNVPEQVPANVSLTTISGESLPLEDWLVTFQLAVVVIDPYTSESSWLLDTAGEILTRFKGADCRVAWVVTSDDDDARTFLGPWADEFLTFCDPDRFFVKGAGLERLPAFVHVRQDRVVIDAAEGWAPDEWDRVAGTLARMMSWSRPEIPAPGSPGAFAGSPA